MSLSKAVIMGEVVRTPEKRFTSNNLAITSFAINISTQQEEELLKVVAMGKLAEKAASDLSKGSKAVIEGKLQTNTVKTAEGEEKKIVELMAQAIEAVGGSVPQEQPANQDYLFQDEDISEDLIGEDEIPF